jgi:hypothetical protein
MAAKYVYTGEDERVYPDLGVVASPGDEVTLDRLPDDGRWVTKASQDKSATPDQPAEKGK